MIGRRAFTLGLGSLLLSAPALAEFKLPAGKPKKKKLLKVVPETPLEQIPNHRQYMRDIVIELSVYAKKRNPKFAVLVRNAPELLIKERREQQWELARDPDGADSGKYTALGSVNRPYLKAIDGMLLDGAFCGHDAYDKPTDDALTLPLKQAADSLAKEGRRILSIDYCRDRKQVASVAKKTAALKALSYIDQDGDKRLGRIPKGHPAGENADHITNLTAAKTLLPMMRSDSYGSRDDWVQALLATNYDVMLLDGFWRGSESLTFADMKALKFKTVGSQRLVLANLQLGRAVDTRHYWKREWEVGNPSWLFAHDPDNDAQMVVEYWNPEWKEIIGTYLKGLIDLGYDGVVLDGLDAYLPFEDMMPID
jgi:endo-alpha-1,4-polygalactosaminidase (GH114 family)